MTTETSKPVVRRGMRTPWGKAEAVEIVAEGVGWVSTHGHGGLKLSAAMNRRVPDFMRRARGWYEEDCEWALAYVPLIGVLSDTDDKTDQLLGAAAETLKSYYPDAYEEYFGTTIPPGESYAKDERAFGAEHADDLVVISALGSRTYPGFVEVTASIGGIRGGNNETIFIVPSDEYDTRGRFGFVIDRARHKTAEEMRTA